MTFEQWFQDQDFYTNMRFIHGDALFIKDGEVYRVLPVQMASEAWQSRQAEVDDLKNLLKKDEYAHSLYYENANLQTLVEEKDKRIEAVSLILEGLKNAKYMHSLNKAYNAILIEKLEKALRGES